jgi:hypothetical protein
MKPYFNLLTLRFNLLKRRVNLLKRGFNFPNSQSKKITLV